MLDSNFCARTFVIVTLSYLSARDIALHRDALTFSDQFSMKFSQSPRAFARYNSVLVFHCFVRVSSF